MKAKKKELRVDYIGGQGSLTLAEEEAITQYLTKSKAGSKKRAKPLKSKSKKVSNTNA
jgi:hypothetical protein